MFSEMKVIDAICFWCGREKECVNVEIKKGQSVDLCWSCLRTKANAESGRQKGKPKHKEELSDDPESTTTDSARSTARASAPSIAATK